MRIAIVAPSPEPFVIGGAENLWWGMEAWLNGPGGHEARLVKLPVRETSLVDLVAGYEAFSRLDVTGYDAVISSKYPAWMVNHPNHTVYLQHTCRGYYDWYPEAQVGGREYRGDDPAIRAILDFIERHRGARAALPEFFERFRALAALPQAQPEIARHPGPLGRAIVHYLDGVGLAPTAIRRYCAIAETVKRRPEYFPRGVKVSVVHHPINKTGFHDAGEEYFFTASRFYPSKRIELLIDAWRLTDIPLPFKIAGAGSEESKLRARAAGDPRIEFVGFVSDAEMVELYAGAMAVPFVPADEDFGYVALEAMLSGKPVITTQDAGGPLELVRDGETGVVAEPTAQSLAAAFRRVHAEREWARGLARRGQELARRIEWPAMFRTLLGEGNERAATARRPRPRMTVLNAFAVHPPTNGGRYRIHAMYKALSRYYDVDLVTLGLREEGAAVIPIVEGLRELRVPRSRAHEEADLAAHRRAHTPVYDMTSLTNIDLTPAYLATLRESLAGAKLAVLSHPYMAEAYKRAGFPGPFVHESHNHEHALKKQMLPDPEARAEFLGLVEAAEGFCCREARLVTAVSDEDARDLLAHYGGKPEDMIVVPNGTDTSSIAFAGAAERARVRRRIGLAEERIALFLASGHRPNLVAAERILELAPRMPDVAFALVGNVADAFLHRPVPSNVWLVGIVSEAARDVWMHVAHVALNPMLHGGGTNLKLLDYFSAGTPVVTTEKGARGTGAVDGVHVLMAAADDMEGAIRKALAGGPAIERMTAAARALAETDFDWAMLADRMHAAIVARALA